MGRFDADPLIFESWKRLESGAFTNKDLQLLNHELFESKFEGIFKTDYLTSHNAANRAGKPFRHRPAHSLRLSPDSFRSKRNFPFDKTNLPSDKITPPPPD